MESGTPSIIDLNAELAKLTMFRGRTPRSTMADRKGSGGRLAAYRDGSLFTTKFAGKGHWESHLTGDELIHILDGAATLEIAREDRPQSFALRAGMIAVIPQGAWHRFQSPEGVTLMTATPSPSEVIELDVDDPRTAGASRREIESGTPSIVDLNTELAKLTMFRRTPQSTAEDRKGSGARLASYRDGAHFAIKFSGKDRTGIPTHRRRAGSHPRRRCDIGHRARGRAAIFRAPCWNGRRHSAGRVASPSLFRGRDADDRDALPRRAYRSRCRRPSDRRGQGGQSSLGTPRT